MWAAKFSAWDNRLSLNAQPMCNGNPSSLGTQPSGSGHHTAATGIHDMAAEPCGLGSCSNHQYEPTKKSRCDIRTPTKALQHHTATQALIKTVWQVIEYRPGRRATTTLLLFAPFCCLQRCTTGVLSPDCTACGTNCTPVNRQSVFIYGLNRLTTRVNSEAFLRCHYNKSWPRERYQFRLRCMQFIAPCEGIVREAVWNHVRPWRCT